MPTPTKNAIGKSTFGPWFPFVELRGSVPPGMQQGLSDITRGGVNGQAYRQEGLRAHVFTMLALRDYTDAAAYKTEHLELRKLVGETLYLLDKHGQSYDDVILLGVKAVQDKAVVRVMGGLVAPAANADKKTPVSPAKILGAFELHLQRTKAALE